jgi:hypothetical protein
MAGLGREKSVTDFFEEYMKQKDTARDVIRLSLERLKVNSRMRSNASYQIKLKHLGHVK